MKKIFKWLKWTLITITTAVLLVLAPIGIYKLYENIRSSFLTDYEKRKEDIERLEYLFKNEFSGYNLLPSSPYFDKEIANLKQSLEKDSLLSQSAFNLSIIKTVASFKDPHTSVFNTSELLGLRFPYYLKWSNGDFYLLSGQVDKKWLGAKVTRFENTLPETVFEKISTYANAPNEAGTAFFISSFMHSPEVLFQEGIIKDQNQIELEVNLDGKTSKLSFKSLPRAQFSTLTDYYRMSDKIGDYEMPLYNKNPEQNYWYAYLEDENLLYLRYSLCVSQGDIQAFWLEVFEEINNLKPEKFVIDVRGNPGGDTQNHNYFLSRIKNDTLVNQFGMLFTLMDRGTGSAAVSFVSEMERFTNTITVGEKTIDKPNTTSDPTFFTLPHSGITILLPNLYSLHSYIHDQRDAVIPDIPIVQNLQGKAYLHDEVMDSIRSLDRKNEQPIFAQLPAEAEGQYTFSPIRNLSIYPDDSIWYISIDGLTVAPIYQEDSLIFTRIYDMVLNLNETVGMQLQIHNSTVNLSKINIEDKSIEKLLIEGNYEMARSKLENLKEDNRLPYYLDRPFFQSRTYSTYNQYGFEKAYELNQLSKVFYPNDPVISIVDFELYQYTNNALGQVKSIIPVVGKVLKRYYTTLTTEKVMNDDYNAFIGK